MFNSSDMVNPFSMVGGAQNSKTISNNFHSGFHWIGFRVMNTVTEMKGPWSVSLECLVFLQVSHSKIRLITSYLHPGQSKKSSNNVESFLVSRMGTSPNFEVGFYQNCSAILP
ncbi:hypothetical protein ACFE04_020615 [Oxalis oulophora]